MSDCSSCSGAVPAAPRPVETAGDLRAKTMTEPAPEAVKRVAPDSVAISPQAQALLAASRPPV